MANNQDTQTGENIGGETPAIEQKEADQTAVSQPAEGGTHNASMPAADAASLSDTPASPQTASSGDSGTGMGPVTASSPSAEAGGPDGVAQLSPKAPRT